MGIHKKSDRCIALLFVLIGIWGMTGCSDPPLEENGVIPRSQDAMTDVLILPDGGQLVDPGNPNNPPPQRDPEQSPPTRVDTRLQYEVTRAGEANQVSCDVYDAQGRLIADVIPSVSVTPENRIIRAAGALTAEIEGVYTVSCVVPAYGLTDDSPSTWTVRPGTPATVITQLVPPSIAAGQMTEVTCGVTDAYGNMLDGTDAQVTFEPQPPMMEAVDGRRFTVFSAGQYRTTCVMPGASNVESALLSVTPGTPTQLSITPVPDQRVYGVGEIVELIIEVSDAHGNIIDEAGTMISSQPQLAQLGARRFSLERAGQYTVTVTVPGSNLSESIQFIVDEGGPAITCVEPAFGAQIQRDAAGDIVLRGRVQDTAGVQGVIVNGRAVNVAGDGSFSANVPVTWGINIQEVVATDVTGEQSSTLCGFFVSERYQDPDELVGDAVRLRISQDAIDDGDTARPYDSLGDLVRVALNEDELVTWLDNTARGLNPIVPTECRVRIPIVGTCIFNAGIVHRSLAVGGPNQASLRLIDGGIRLSLEILDIDVGAQLTGTLTNRGTISAEYVRATADFSLFLNNDGSLQTQLRQISGVEVGDISSDFEGIVTGSALEALVFLMETFFSDGIIARVTAFLETKARDALDEFFGGFELSGFAARVDVPSLAGGAGTPLIINNRLSEVDFNADRAILGIAVGIDGDDEPGHRSLGSAIPPGPLLAPQGGADANATLDLTVVNLVLHQLWKSGYFERQAADLVREFTGGFPGFRVDLQLPLPPTVMGQGQDGTIRLFFGPLFGDVLAPPLGNEPLGIRASAEVDVGIVLVEGNAIRFEPITVSELLVSVDEASIGQAGRATLDELLLDIIQGVLRDTLSGSIPALPIPRFAVPEALTQFGVPAGLSLGISQPQLSGNSRTWEVTGRFSEVVDPVAPADPGPDMGGGDPVGMCENTCRFAMDGECDDGGPDSLFGFCDLGTDCADCGPR